MPSLWATRCATWVLRLERHGATSLLLRCVRTFQLIEGRDRVLMLAGQGFIALVPLLVVVASLTGASGAGGVGEGLVERWGLTGSAAAAVTSLFAYPPGATGGVTLFSAGLLLFSLNGFARSVERTFQGAWGLRRTGFRGKVDRTAGLAVLLGAGFAAGWVRQRLDTVPAGLVLGLAAQAAVVVGGWVLGTSLMLSRRVPTRSLLGGAVLSTVLQLVVGWGTALYVPELVARNAERYGVVGVALALVTWLLAVASVIVGAAVVGAVLGTSAHPAARRS